MGGRRLVGVVATDVREEGHVEGGLRLNDLGRADGRVEAVDVNLIVVRQGPLKNVRQREPDLLVSPDFPYVLPGIGVYLIVFFLHLIAEVRDLEPPLEAFRRHRRVGHVKPEYCFVRRLGRRDASHKLDGRRCVDRGRFRHRIEFPRDHSVFVLLDLGIVKLVAAEVATQKHDHSQQRQ